MCDQTIIINHTPTLMHSLHCPQTGGTNAAAAGDEEEEEESGDDDDPTFANSFSASSKNLQNTGHTRWRSMMVVAVAVKGSGHHYLCPRSSIITIVLFLNHKSPIIIILILNNQPSSSSSSLPHGSGPQISGCRRKVGGVAKAELKHKAD